MSLVLPPVEEEEGDGGKGEIGCGEGGEFEKGCGGG